MARFNINKFEGMGIDAYDPSPTKFSISKGFDILTYPFRLSPVRGMTTDTTGTLIGNIIAGRDSNFYGIGTDPLNPADGYLYIRSAGTWIATDTGGSHTNSKTGEAVVYPLLVEYHTSGAARRILVGGTNKIWILDPTGVAATASHNLTYSNIGQGIVHPTDDTLYIPYDNNIAVNNNGSWTDVGVTFPSTTRITALAPYGNYLAIFVVPSISGVDLPGVTKCYLWNRDTSLTTLSEVIDWGTGIVKAADNLNGTLVAIADGSGASSTVLDRDSIVIKGYNGGQPQLIREISTNKQTATTPDAVVNPFVSFVYRNRYYFSVGVNGGSTSPNYQGLWSVGRSKITNNFSVTIERAATTDDSETAVLAAAAIGDVFVMNHTAPGTLTATVSSATGSDGSSLTVFPYSAYYETNINPGFQPIDMTVKKQLNAVAVSYRPLGAAAQAILKYRIDGGSWTTVFTETTDSATSSEFTLTSSGTEFTSGRYYEFRIESTGGAEIVELAGRYTVLKSAITG